MGMAPAATPPTAPINIDVGRQLFCDPFIVGPGSSGIVHTEKYRSPSDAELLRENPCLEAESISACSCWPLVEAELLDLLGDIAVGQTDDLAGQHHGKTTVTLGMVNMLLERGLKVGYQKPVGQQTVPVMDGALGELQARPRPFSARPPEPFQRTS